MRGALAAVVLAAMVVACGAQTIGPSPSPMPPIGGTLRVGIGPDVELMRGTVLYDPGSEDVVSGLLISCCLGRTLLTYPGAPAAEGGTVLLPDLATELPTVSEDGRTWTFHLRPGIRYAPPYDDLEVTASDFVHTVERHARRSPVLTEPFVGLPYAHILGAEDYAAGAAPSITGLSAPEPHTLVVRLTEPYRGFATMVTLPAWSPLPQAVVGTHDDDLGAHWASTGPYMLDPYPADPSADRFDLVRNPSWDRATDPRRGAWVDRIEVSPAGSLDAAHDAVDAGRLDLVDWLMTGELLERYRADPASSVRVRTTSSETIFWIPMNLAVPPFDDVAVRRAVNAVVDRAALRDLILEARGRFGPQPPGRITQHVFPDAITGGLLVSYAPWASPGDHGDVARARAEMSASRYDSDGDGRCDQPACLHVRLAADDRAAGLRLSRDLAAIGIDADVVEVDESTDIAFVRNQTPIQVNTFGWGFNLTGEDLAGLLRGSAIDPEQQTLNGSLVGATPGQLAEWGYRVDAVPGLDDVIDRCSAAAGHLRARCWAEVDQFVTEALVPWVPIFSFELARASSNRVASWSPDQAAPFGFPALDQTVLRPDATP